MSKAHALAGLWIFLAAFGALALPSRAEPTDIAVRVISKDAKFIGTSMGGVLITIRMRRRASYWRTAHHKAQPAIPVGS